MTVIERRIERAIQDGEDVLTGQLGAPPNEEAWADLADMVIGDLADDYRGAVDELERVRGRVEVAIDSLRHNRHLGDHAAVLLRRALNDVGGQ